MRIEGLQFVVAFVNTLLVLLILAASRRSRLVDGIALLLVLGTPAALWQMERHRRPRVEESAVENRPVQVDDGGYVSSAACQACHPEHHATWFASYHRTMTQVATPESVIGDFDGRERLSYGKKYRLHREGEEFFVEMEVPGSGATTPGRVTRPIVMTTGSHHMQAYWYATGDGREISLVPFVYLRADRRWIPERSSFLKPPLAGLPDFDGLWNRSCQQCHSTAPQPRLGANDTRTAELGIACEACHGPGAEHVNKYRDPQRRYRSHLRGEADPEIVNPAKLPARRSAEICGQCHGVWQAVDGDEFRKSVDSGFTFRPGEDLSTSKFLFHKENLATPRLHALLRQDKHFAEDRFWPDGVLRVAGREYTGLLDTPCFNHGDPEKKQMDCLDCHALHKTPDDPRSLEAWADDQLKPGMRGNDACLQCHEEYRERLEDHTHHPPSSPGSNCYNCHMPHTAYALLKAIRSHTVEIPSVVASVQTGRPNGCNQCHLDRPLGWTADHLRDWYGIERPALTADHESIAASVLWSLRGDAAQRALMAWSMGWGPAQQASKRDWLIPFLAQMLPDPYEAVRYIAYRSLRTLPGCADFEYDFVGTESERNAVFARAMKIWARVRRTTGSSILIDERKELNEVQWQRLLGERNHRRVSLEE